MVLEGTLAHVSGSCEEPSITGGSVGISEENEYKGEVSVQVKRKRREEVNIFFINPFSLS